MNRTMYPCAALSGGVLLLFLLLAMPSMAQLSGGSAFLQGDFLEVGVSPCGTYGTPNPGSPIPVAGFVGGPYHPTNPGLGFVADSEADGWGISTPPLPPYCGDYFWPGSPVEGFALMIGGNLYTNTNGFAICSTGDMRGTISSYTTTGDTLRSIWQGNSPAASPFNFQIKQNTYFPKDKLYFVTEVTLYNTGATTFNDIYYVRQVDPDNDQPWSGTFITDNRIISQPTPGNSDALVTATGVTGCFLGLGARNFAARVCYGGFFLTTPEETYCGLSPYSLTGESLGTDIAIAVSFYFQELVPGDSLSFSLAYVLDESYLEEALSNTVDLNVLANGIDINDLDTAAVDTSNTYEITICPGDTVDLQLDGGDNYTWTWSPAAGLDTTGGVEVIVVTDSSITYTVTSSVPCGTDIGFEISIIVDNPAAGIDVSDDAFLCLGDSVFLNSGGLPPGSNVLWTPSDFLDNDTIVNPNAYITVPDTSITYVGTFTSASGCEYVDSVTVTIYPEAVADAGPDLVVPLGSGVELAATGGVSYVWTPSTYLSDPNIPNPYLEPEDTITYILLVTNASGCEDVDTMTVFVLDDPQLIVPNAFTPNGDGVNDLFQPIILGNAILFDVAVFNRWGEQVWYSARSGQGWDGTANGEAQEMGTYIVIVRIIDAKGETLQQSGTLTLLR